MYLKVILKISTYILNFFTLFPNWNLEKRTKKQHDQYCNMIICTVVKIIAIFQSENIGIQQFHLVKLCCGRYSLCQKYKFMLSVAPALAKDWLATSTFLLIPSACDCVVCRMEDPHHTQLEDAEPKGTKALQRFHYTVEKMAMQLYCRLMSSGSFKYHVALSLPSVQPLNYLNVNGCLCCAELVCVWIDIWREFVFCFFSQFCHPKASASRPSQ